MFPKNASSSLSQTESVSYTELLGALNDTGVENVIRVLRAHSIEKIQGYIAMIPDLQERTDFALNLKISRLEKALKWADDQGGLGVILNSIDENAQLAFLSKCLEEGSSSLISAENCHKYLNKLKEAEQIQFLLLLIKKFRFSGADIGTYFQVLGVLKTQAAKDLLLPQILSFSQTPWTPSEISRIFPHLCSSPSSPCLSAECVIEYLHQLITPSLRTNQACQWDSEIWSFNDMLLVCRSICTSPEELDEQLIQYFAHARAPLPTNFFHSFLANFFTKINEEPGFISVEQSGFYAGLEKAYCEQNQLITPDAAISENEAITARVKALEPSVIEGIRNLATKLTDEATKVGMVTEMFSRGAKIKVAKASCLISIANLLDSVREDRITVKDWRAEINAYVFQAAQMGVTLEKLLDHKTGEAMLGVINALQLAPSAASSASAAAATEETSDALVILNTLRR